MTELRHPEDATLLGLLVDGFERNEMLGGFHMRTLPLPDEVAAVRKFVELADEGLRWKGEPLKRESSTSRELVAWSDMEIRRAGRGIMVRVKAPRFDDWWSETTTWTGDPMGPIFDWIKER